MLHLVLYACDTVPAAVLGALGIQVGQGACDKVQPTIDGVMARTSSFAAARPIC